jgi:hypothetical protein
VLVMVVVVVVLVVVFSELQMGFYLVAVVPK